MADDRKEDGKISLRSQKYDRDLYNLELALIRTNAGLLPEGDLDGLVARSNSYHPERLLTALTLVAMVQRKNTFNPSETLLSKEFISTITNGQFQNDLKRLEESNPGIKQRIHDYYADHFAKYPQRQEEQSVKSPKEKSNIEKGGEIAGGMAEKVPVVGGIFGTIRKTIKNKTDENNKKPENEEAPYVRLPDPVTLSRFEGNGRTNERARDSDDRLPTRSRRATGERSDEHNNKPGILSIPDVLKLPEGTYVEELEGVETELEKARLLKIDPRDKGKVYTKVIEKLIKALDTLYDRQDMDGNPAKDDISVEKVRNAVGQEIKDQEKENQQQNRKPEPPPTAQQDTPAPKGDKFTLKYLLENKQGKFSSQIAALEEMLMKADLLGEDPHRKPLKEDPHSKIGVVTPAIIDRLLGALNALGIKGTGSAHSFTANDPISIEQAEAAAGKKIKEEGPKNNGRPQLKRRSEATPEKGDVPVEITQALEQYRLQQSDPGSPLSLPPKPLGNDKRIG